MSTETSKPKTAAKAPVMGMSWTTMALLIATAVASVRGLPAIAGYEWASIFLYILPALVFMIPVALVAAELASGWKFDVRCSPLERTNRSTSGMSGWYSRCRMSFSPMADGLMRPFATSSAIERTASTS